MANLVSDYVNLEGADYRRATNILLVHNWTRPFLRQ